MAYRIVDQHWLKRASYGSHPGRSNILDWHAHTDRVDFAIAGKTRNERGTLKSAPTAVDRMREQKCLPLAFRQTTPELPAHERMHLRVFVGWPIDDEEAVAFSERKDVAVEVRITKSGCSWVRKTL
ncbi:MAG: hypothetical protein WAK55_00725 [Xanthobacteraceae bacterium]